MISINNNNVNDNQQKYYSARFNNYNFYIILTK